ncbi:DUF389 domain-containing protein [uncultured Dokdonia sp.]|uniref:DUF389 domain-containing protein n=1 Tax=uncultured Dokdonia sp. TaxID=575653 RepID=UPI002622818A|nr:DUF389 domain-containing protein [uncultured Dokdonia sp.]
MDEADKEIQQNKEAVKQNAKGLWETIKKFLSELLDIRQDTDRDATVEAVRKDIPFKGHNAWILIFSIFIASIGLNVSSTAVVIGAMLISPLMGPIVGVGLSTAINDGVMLRRSFVNLGIMVFLSVLTAFVYFRISPLTELTPELEARTYPTILDVFIAIFGGLALIVAKTKKGTIASVIFGVAIATALMPPLCTVGYGLAVGNWTFAGGALYLFSINAVFIALATFVVVKLLRFPMVKYANQKQRKRVTLIATLVAITVIVPSIILFVKLYQKQIFVNDVKLFVNEVVDYEGVEVIKFTEDYDRKEIDLYLIGNLVPQNKVQAWQTKLEKIKGLELTSLVVHQGADQSSALAAQLSSQVKSGILEDLYLKNQENLQGKDAQIELLEEQIVRLKGAALPFDRLGEEVKTLYDGLEGFAYANMVYSNFKSSDTITTFKLGWVDTIPLVVRQKNNEKIADWLKKRFNLDTLVIEEYTAKEFVALGQQTKT